MDVYVASENYRARRLLFGYSMPVAMPGRTLAYLQNLQFQFPLPTNSSFFTEFFRSGRRRRQARATDDRAVFYRMVEHELERRGRPGRDCIKRSICESAETPLKDDGLMGEIFHVLLTPDYGNSVNVDSSYKEAAEVGRMGQDCSKAFSACPEGLGILDHVSEVLEYY
ncbi:hypothetical protein QAD02_024351 [Eretmocerus hayati]|uniref:Uncharacterized protein n=1 Tax=Eretmocerus hayati TaxID=131215 RepID=A0ACC2Q0N3_9HYME|nr:hypothetical protein QAD02_024351 [Eretmocerus hayati]